MVSITLEMIRTEWEKDSAINEMELDKVLSDLPKVFTRYLDYHTAVTMMMRKQQSLLRKETKIKWMYYTGKLDHDELLRLKLEPFQHKILKQDIDKFLGADEQIDILEQKICYYREMLKYLEEIMKMLNNRGYHVKSMIDWKRFTHGVD